MNEVKKIELTGNQIKDIFDAGYRKGEQDQSDYEWGSRPSVKKDDELVWALTDILGCTAEVAVNILNCISDA